MNDNVLEYKGYHTRIVFVAESKSLRGIIEGINDYVDFESSNPNEIENEFHSAVDDYIEFCKEVGKEPEKEYKGSFNVRITPDLHRKLAKLSIQNGTSLNNEVENAISAYVDQQKKAGITEGAVAQETDTMLARIQNTNKHSNLTYVQFGEMKVKTE